MKLNLDNGRLTIVFPPAVNSTNHTKLSKTLLAFLDDHPVKSCCFDCSELRLITSSGLRMILQVAGMIKDTEICEVSDEIYEIFDVTGFTDIIKIRKRLKTIDIADCPLIGKGRNAAVYRYDMDTIVKVYLRSGISFEDVQREHLLARRAFIMGVPTAMSLSIVSVDGHLGAMYEMIDAKSFIKLIKERPEHIEENIKKYSDMVKHINSIEANGIDELVDKKAEYIDWMSSLKEHLTEEEFGRVCALTTLIPDSKMLVHGDCQPGNVLLQGDEIIIIDMDTIGFGDSCLELSNIYATLVAFRPFDREYELSTEESTLCWRLFELEYFAAVPEEEKNRKLSLCKALAFGRAYRYGLRHRERVEDQHIAYLKAQLFNSIDELGI